MDRYHITLNCAQWQMKQVGNDTAILTATTKQALIRLMRDYMRDKIGSVKIHKRDGRFQEERTYPRKYDPTASEG